MHISLIVLSLFLNYSLLKAEDVVENKSPLSAQAKIEIAKLSQEGQAFLRAKKFKEVEHIASQIFQISAQSPESFFLNGAVSYGNGDYRKGIISLEKALTLNPDHDLSLFYTGMCYFKLNQFEKSILYLNKAAESGSFHPFYRFNLAIAYYFAGNYEKARQESEKTLRLKENYLKARVILIRSLMKLDKKPEALEHAKDMFEKKQELDSVTSLYAELLMEEGKNFKEVIQILTKKPALSLKERKILAYSFLQEGEIYKASTVYKQIVQGEKESEEDAINYLKCLVLLNKDDEAEKQITLLIRSNPNSKKLYLNTYMELVERRNTIRIMYQPIP